MNSHLYLGIELAYNFKWSRHIDNIVAKASERLGLLKRALKPANVWDPCLAKGIKKLEKVQSRAIQFIFNLKG